MSEGTISYLIGCHHFFFHPLWVLVAWYKEYRRWPKFWELDLFDLRQGGVVIGRFLNAC